MSTLLSSSTNASVAQLKAYLEEGFTSDERQSIIQFLLDYHRHNDIRQLVSAVAPLLNTTVKQRFVGILRRVLPIKDVASYDHLWVQMWGEPAIHILLPWKTRHGVPSSTTSLHEQASPIRLEEVILVHSPTRHDVLLTNRCGSNDDVIVGSIRVGCEADRAGLRQGDRIIAINGTSCVHLTPRHVDKLLRESTSTPICLRVDRSGRSSWRPASLPRNSRAAPSNGSRQHLGPSNFSWVDKKGRSVSPPRFHPITGEPSQHYPMIQVLVEVLSGETMGCSVRGGREFGLGIFVADIEPGSPVQRGGLVIGDEILDLNGISFRNIFHSEAIDILRRTSRLHLLVHRIGRLPYSLLSSTRVPAHPVSERNGDHRAATLNSQHRRITHSSMGLNTLPSNRVDGLSNGESREEAKPSRRQQRKMYQHAAGRETGAMVRAKSTPDVNRGSRVRTLSPAPARRHHPMDEEEQIIPTSHLHASPMPNHSPPPSSRHHTQQQALVRRPLEGYMSGRLTVDQMTRQVFAMLPHRLDVSEKDVLKDLRDCLNPRDRTRFDEIVAAHKTGIDNNSESSDSMLVYYDDEALVPKTNGQMRPKQKSLGHSSTNDKKKKEEITSLDDVIRLLSIDPGSREDYPRLGEDAVEYELTGGDSVDEVVHFDGDVKKVLIRINDDKGVGLSIEGGSDTSIPLPRIAKIQSKGIYRVRLQCWPTFENLGIGVTGGSNTRACPIIKIVDIKPGGSAYESKLLKLGQVILQVNGMPLDGMRHRESAREISRAFKERHADKMELLVAEPWITEERLNEVILTSKQLMENENQ